MHTVHRDQLILPQDGEARGRLWRERLAPVFDIDFGHHTDLSAQLDLTTYLCGDTIIGSVSAPVQRLQRTERKIAQQGLDHLLFQFYEKGSSIMRAERREDAVDASRFLVVDLSRPVVLEAAAVDAINLIVPRRYIADLLGSADHLHGRAFDVGGDEVAQMLRAYLRSLVNSLSGLPAERAVMMSRAAIHLCCACLPLAGPELRSAPPMLKLAIRQFVEETIAQPYPSIATVVARFGLSRSKLQRLFESEGGFASYVLERRLQRAHAALMSQTAEGRSLVSSVAYAYGWSDLSTFSHAYRRRFGTAPSQAGAALVGAAVSDGEGVLLSWMNQMITA